MKSKSFFLYLIPILAMHIFALFGYYHVKKNQQAKIDVHDLDVRIEFSKTDIIPKAVPKKIVEKKKKSIKKKTVSKRLPEERIEQAQEEKIVKRVEKIDFLKTQAGKKIFLSYKEELKLYL